MTELFRLIRQYPGETVALVIVSGLLIAAGFGGLMAYWSRQEEQAEMRRAWRHPRVHRTAAQRGVGRGD